MEPIVSRYKAPIHCLCAVCGTNLHNKVSLFDRVEKEWYCDADCRADWYELQDIPIPPEY